MFGFIKMLQRIISKLKSNKRLWFTSIFIISVSGIGLSLFMLISTTNRIAKEVYNSEVKQFDLRYKDLEKLKEKRLQKLAVLASLNHTIMEKLEKNDTNGILELENEINAKIVEKEKDLLAFKFYMTQNSAEVLRPSLVTAVQTKNVIFGVEVLPDGLFYVYLLPIEKDNKVIGVIEARESIYSLKDSFSRLNQQCVVLLDVKMLPMLSLQNRDGLYQDVGKNYLINNKAYDNATLGLITSIDDISLRKIAMGEYVVNKESFFNGMIMRDSNGVEIGLVIMGESINKEGGFINMTQKMTQQVIAIALGLIVSLLLFLF